MTGRARGRIPRVQGTPGASDEPKPSSQPDQRRLPQKPSLAEVAGSRGEGFTSAASMTSPSYGAEAEGQALCTGMGELALFGPESSFYSASSVVHTRPANIVETTGNSGMPVNLFKLDRMTDFRLFQYHVDFKPDVPNKEMRARLIQEHTSVIGKIFMFDGMILFLPIQLSDVTEMHSVHTVLLNDVKITLKLTNEIDPSSPICMQLYNIIFKRVLSCIKLVPIGRNYYSPSQAITVHQHKLEVWPGFVTSILQFEKNVMLIADMSHKILYGTTVWSVMQELFQKSGFNNQRYRDSCAKKLVGEIVLTRYNSKMYRLDAIDWNKNPESVFATGKMDMTFVDYYSKHHHITIHDKKQPLLISMPKSKEKRGPNALVPELCYLTGLSEEARSDLRVVKDISVHTSLGAQRRVRALQRLKAEIKSDEHAVTEWSNWHLDFARTLHDVHSRQLPPAEMSLDLKQFTCDPVVADWSSEMRSQQLINPQRVDNWILMDSEQSADDLVSVLYKVCPSFGMQVNAPKMIQLPNDKVPTLMSVLKTQMTADTNLVVCILPTSRKDRYDAVKMFCCIEQPVPSQLNLSRSLMKKAMQVSVVTKLALQLNCKLGGELWTVAIPIKNLMIVGIDCYRDSSRRGHSVGALIASTNASFTRFYSRCTFQSSMEDLMNRLGNCMIDALKAYRTANGALPERLVIYRNEVGDRQLKAVLEQEVTQMQEIFEAASPGYNPKYAFLVVKKRIHSRFFLKNNDGSVVNPLPGTVVDTDATCPEWYESFLDSQSVRQGTVSPTHYNVLHDSTGMKADHLQRLTYKLCDVDFDLDSPISDDFGAESALLKKTKVETERKTASNHSARDSQADDENANYSNNQTCPHWACAQCNQDNAGRRKSCKKCQQPKYLGGIAPPPYWSYWAPTDTGVRLITLSPEEPIFEEISGIFYGNLKCSVNGLRAPIVLEEPPEYEIFRIERVENLKLYQEYKFQLNQMEQVEELKTGAEVLLYHGCSAANLQNITSSGLNRAFAGTNGTDWGKGVYFSSNTEYSSDDQFSPIDHYKHKKILLCRVAVGRYVEGSPDLLEAPLIPGTDDHYESVVDDEERPLIYVIFKDSQAYVEYIVTIRESCLVLFCARK